MTVLVAWQAKLDISGMRVELLRSRWQWWAAAAQYVFAVPHISHRLSVHTSVNPLAKLSQFRCTYSSDCMRSPPPLSGSASERISQTSSLLCCLERVVAQGFLDMQ